jgi:hypothetical protein
LHAAAWRETDGQPPGTHRPQKIGALATDETRMEKTKMAPAAPEAEWRFADLFACLIWDKISLNPPTRFIR